MMFAVKFVRLCLFTASFLAILKNCLADKVRCDVIATVSVDKLGSYNCSLYSLDSLLQQNISCSSIKDTLDLLSGDPSMDTGCVEVIISQGQYLIEGRVNISRDVYIHGREGHSVAIHLQVQGSTPPEFLYSLSFRNTSYVRFWNVEFTGSEGVIGFDNVSRVEVIHSSFRYFVQGAVDIYNSHEVMVLNCTFENNGPARITKLFAWRGHSGGLSIAFNYLQALNRTNLTVLVSGSTFRNNSVLAAVRGPQTTSQLLQRFIPTGRGGGCAINVNSVTSAHVTVESCMFERNHALTYGGGLYFAWDKVSGHRTILRNIQFIENESPGGAGGLELGFARGGTESNGNQVYAYNLYFLRNRATYGGSVYVFIASREIREGAIGNFVHFQDCVFKNNSAVEYGGAIGLILPSANVIFDSRENIRPIVFDGCSFVGNDGGRGGAVSTSYLPLRFVGNNTLAENKGSALTILGTKVQLRGHLNFLHNEAPSSGGALYAISLGQLELANGSTVVFQNNTGNFGAGIVVASIYVPILYNELIYDPLCVLLLEDSTQSFSQQNPSQISMLFSGNRAVVGAAVYTNQIGLCSWTGALVGNRPYFNRSIAFKWDFIRFSDDNQNSAHASDSVNPRYYVQTQEGELNIASTNLTVYPGESIQFGVAVRDELNLSTVSVLRFSDLNKALEFVPSVISLSHVDQPGVNISILINSSSGRGHADDTNLVTVESLLHKTVEKASFFVTILPCPAGYIIARDSAHPQFNICQCDLQNQGIVSCDGLSVQIRDGYWASSSTLFTYPCPLQYCRCHMEFGGSGKQQCSNVLNGTDPDSQCICDRQGILCGSCRGGKGYSAILNRCVSCSNSSALLIVGLVLADSLVYIVLILLSFQFPGWIYPCLFYLQILPYIAEHFSPTFEHVYNPLYYFTSGLSFYFVYDFCLLQGLSPLLAYFFRYIPLLTAVSICPVVLLIMSKCCRKMSREMHHRLSSWHGLWWIVVLIYPHIVYTSMSILNCPSVHVGKNTKSHRWYVSGDIECFRGYHLPLALFAILILLVCFLAIPFVAIIATKQISNHLSESISAPFRSQYKWWSAVELARRLVLILFVVAFPAFSFPAMLVISVLIVITGLTWPYRSSISSVLDIILAIDVMILLLLSNTKQAKEDLSDVLFKRLNGTGSCTDFELDISTRSFILLPFYYLPLLVTLVALCVWVAMMIRYHVRARHSTSINIDQDYVFTGSDIFVRPERAPTLSEVKLELLQNEGNPEGYKFVSPYTEVS